MLPNWLLDTTIAAYLLCGLMLLFAISLRIRCGSWSNPSVVFALFWGMMVLMPIVFVPEIEPSVFAVGYITAAVGAFGLPAFGFDWHQPLTAVAARRDSGTGSVFLAGNEAVTLLIIAQSVVMGCMMLNVAHQGFSLRDLVFDPFAIGCEYLGYRYSGSVKPFLLSQVATVLNYVCAALAGLIVAQRRNYLLSAGVVLLGMLPSLYSIAIYADKGSVFLSLAFFYGAVVVGRIRNGSTVLLTYRSVVSAPLIMIIVAGAIGLAMANRISEVCADRQTGTLVGTVVQSVTPSTTTSVAPPESAESANSDKMKSYVRSYAFGHLFAFSDWFDHWLDHGQTLPDHTVSNPAFQPHWNRPDAPNLYRNPEHPTLGFWTFMAIGKYVNPQYFETLPDGYFEEYFLRTGVIQTNIYTVFRGLIYDYTVVGSLFVLSLFGAIFNWLYRQLLIAPTLSMPQTAYIFFAGYLYTSYIISLLLWSSVIASSIGTLVMLATVGYIDRQGGSIVGLSRRRWGRPADARS